MEFQPLGDRVLAKRIQIEKKTAAGIILSGTTDEIEERDTAFARVIAVGPGKHASDGTLIPTKCVVGDIVVYNERMPIKFANPEGGTFDLLNEANILMIVRGDDVVEADESYHVDTSKIFNAPKYLG